MTEQTQHPELGELWDALELKDGQQVTELVLIAKCADFEHGGTAISLSATDGIDWITQLGMIEYARLIMRKGLDKDSDAAD